MPVFALVACAFASYPRNQWLEPMSMKLFPMVFPRSSKASGLISNFLTHFVFIFIGYIFLMVWLIGGGKNKKYIRTFSFKNIQRANMSLLI